MNKEIERCANCNKIITGKMKDNQEVIYGNAEHTLYDSKENLLSFGDTDSIFEGVFCSRYCFNEVVGVNLAYKNGRKDLAREILKEIKLEIEKLDFKAFNHCFKRGKMCDECWNKKQPLNRLKKITEKIGDLV